MKTLTKQGAIERIREIQKENKVNHLTFFGEEAEYYTHAGAIRELMHLFDIKEEEL